MRELTERKSQQMTTTDNNSVNSQITEIEKGQTKQPTEVQPRVVIVGLGFGGLLAARALRDAPVQVTVIDKSNHHLFQPLLYQVATAGLSPADISRRFAASSKNRPIRGC